MFKKVVYCSPIEGVLHWAGKPVAGAVVTRELHSGGFQGGKYSDSVMSNELGRFQFDVVQERRIFRPDLLSANPHVSQTLEVVYQRETYTIWAFQKQDFEFGSESKNGALKINCDLANFEEYSHGRIVRCQHNGISKYE